MRLQQSVFLVLALALFLCIGSSQSVHAYTAQPNPQNETCFSCHNSESLSMTRDGEKISLYVDQDMYNNTPHAQIACVRCHEEIQAEPRHPSGGAQEELPEGREAVIEISERCVKCHRGVIEDSYNQSFHGSALQLGSTTVATCVDCHGVHNILPEDDPESTVNQANLADTCGSCHTGAGQGIAMGEEHVIPARAGSPIIGYVWKFFIALILFDTVMNGPMISFELFRRLKDDLKARRAQKGGQSHGV